MTLADISHKRQIVSDPVQVQHYGLELGFGETLSRDDLVCTNLSCDAQIAQPLNQIRSHLLIWRHNKCLEVPSRNWHLPVFPPHKAVS
jgi:hypothetical protein